MSNAQKEALKKITALLQSELSPNAEDFSKIEVAMSGDDKFVLQVPESLFSTVGTIASIFKIDSHDLEIEPNPPSGTKQIYIQANPVLLKIANFDISNVKKRIDSLKTQTHAEIKDETTTEVKLQKIDKFLHQNLSSDELDFAKNSHEDGQDTVKFFSAQQQGNEVTIHVPPRNYPRTAMADKFGLEEGDFSRKNQGNISSVLRCDTDRLYGSMQSVKHLDISLQASNEGASANRNNKGGIDVKIGSSSTEVNVDVFYDVMKENPNKSLIGLVVESCRKEVELFLKNNFQDVTVSLGDIENNHRMVEINYTKIGEDEPKKYKDSLTNAYKKMKQAQQMQKNKPTSHQDRLKSKGRNTNIVSP